MDYTKKNELDMVDLVFLLVGFADSTINNPEHLKNMLKDLSEAEDKMKYLAQYCNDFLEISFESFMISIENQKPPIRYESDVKNQKIMELAKNPKGTC